MKFCFGLLFLLTAFLVALPTGSVQACGDVRTVTAQKNTVLPVNDAHCASTDDACVGTHPGETCPPDTDGCGHCHCPGCGATAAPAAGFFKSTLVEIPVYNGPQEDQPTNFSYQAPHTSAYLDALFQPPRV